VDLSRYSQWDAVREHVYRRNLIVHNGAKVNDLYRKKLKRDVSAQRAHTDMPYVTSAVDNMKGFVKHVHTVVSPKFGAHET
jgi:hypothetical protein